MSASPEREIALAWAAAGWPVIPLVRWTKKPALPKGYVPTTDPEQVMRWWSGSRHRAGVGVVISGQGVIVVDIDGPRAEDTLAWLMRVSGCEELPETFETTTGRGVHRWYRLPPGVPVVRNQLAHHYERPDVDVKVNGLMVGPGSLHQSGRVYASNWPAVPRIEDLPEFPLSLYDYFVKTAKGTGTSERRTVSRQANRTVEVDASLMAEPPQAVADLLANRSDGRDRRLLLAIQRLVDAGWDDEVIIATCLAHPLGDKAREQTDPIGYLMHKIEAARRYVRRPDFDTEAWWWAIHTSGLPAGTLRLADVLLRYQHHGYVRRGQNWLGIQSAQSAPAAKNALDSLVTHGLLVVTAPHDKETPTTYRLLCPNAEVDPHRAGNGGEGAHQRYSLRVNFRAGPIPTHLIGHDAFYRAAGSLGSAYPVLALIAALRGSATPERLVTDGCLSPREVASKIALLEASGLVISEAGLFRLTDEPLAPLLDAAAQVAGTDGRRDTAWAMYQEDSHRFREAKVPGSDWWMGRRQHYYRARIEGAETGSADACILRALGGDLDVAASRMAEIELLAHEQLHPASADQLRKTLNAQHEAA